MFKSSALCEVEKTCQIAGDKNFCWQPKSSIFDVVEYEGKQSYTSSGVPCTNWNDQTYRLEWEIRLFTRLVCFLPPGF